MAVGAKIRGPNGPAEIKSTHPPPLAFVLVHLRYPSVLSYKGLEGAPSLDRMGKCASHIPLPPGVAQARMNPMRTPTPDAWGTQGGESQIHPHKLYNRRRCAIYSRDRGSGQRLLSARSPRWEATLAEGPIVLR
jgi:hypothetical protein